MTVSMELASYRDEPSEEIGTIRRVRGRVVSALAAAGVVTLDAFAAVGDQYGPVVWMHDVETAGANQRAGKLPESTSSERIETEQKSCP
jgi:hypothetical protein